jgi:hypothetical protein
LGGALLLGGGALLLSVAGEGFTPIAPSGTVLAGPARWVEAVNDQGSRAWPPAAPQGKKIVQPKDSVPALGQEPDCVFIPSPPEAVDAMLKLADVKPGEVLFDLGSGDGRICMAAARKYRARAYGYEIDAERVKEALENVKKNKVQHLVTIERRDIFKLDLSGADVVIMWLLPCLNVKLIPQLEKMKRGSRIVSLDFDMLGVVKPDKVIEVEVKTGGRVVRKPRIYLWKTPLKKDEKRFREWYPRCAVVGK